MPINDYENITIGGKTFTKAYANDSNNQEEIRQAIVNGNNNITVADKMGNVYDNATGKQLNTIQQPQISIYDPTNDINSMKEYQKQQAMLGLSNARNSSLSNLNSERATIQPQYYKQRANESTSSQLGAKNFAEYMASRGQSSAGASMQGELNRNVTLQGNIGALNQQEQGAYDTNTRRVTDTNNAFNNDVASANAGIEANSMQALINAKQQANADAIAQANADRNFNYGVSRDAVNDTNYANETAYNQGRDTISDNRYNDTTAYNQGRDTVADNRYNTETAYNKSRDVVSDNRYASETAYNHAQDVIANNAKLAALKVSAAKASNGNSSKGLTQTQLNTQTLAMAAAQEKNGTGTQWLKANEKAIKAQPGGVELYPKLVAKIKATKTDPDIAYQTAKAIAARKNNNMQPQ